MIEITPSLHIDDGAVEEVFLRSPGPGGQHVNKVETGVQLRFNAAASPAIPPDMLSRLRALAGRRMTKAGVLIISAHRHSAQERNRTDAKSRLVELLRLAAIEPKRRRPTKPTKASKQRRLNSKKRRSDVKKGRGRVHDPG